MNTCDTYKITEEVSMDSKIQYLIRIDGTEMAFCDSEDEAIIAISSIANKEIKNLENDWTKVFRQDLEDGKKIIISTQALGNLYNGSMVETMIIDIVAVGHCFLTKGIHELPRKIETNQNLTSVPVPDILQKLAQVNLDEETLEESNEEEEPSEESYEVEEVDASEEDQQ